MAYNLDVNIQYPMFISFLHVNRDKMIFVLYYSYCYHTSHQSHDEHMTFILRIDHSKARDISMPYKKLVKH